MTRSSRGRKARARTRKMSRNAAMKQQQNAAGEGFATGQDQSENKPNWSSRDKKYLLGFAVLSLVLTACYWWMGGRNLFVFPAVFCLSVGARKYWTGPMRRFADKS